GEAIDDAGGVDALGDPERVGVVVGRGGYFTPGMARFDQRVRVAQQLVESLRDLVPDIDDDRLELVKTAFQDQLGPSRPEAAIDLVPNLAASRIANRLDFQGPAFTVDGACASSLLAVELAARELESGRSDAMVVGGVHHCHDVAFWAVFSQLRALSPSQQIRPFDQRADGLLIGEGTGMVVLKRLDAAEAAGDRVYAVIRGTGTASDGRASSVMKPRVAGQVQALRRAYAESGVDPATVDLIEAHGTGTPVGDEAELDTIARFFGSPNGASGTLGSVKSMIGHAMPAAGMAALIKTALALHHRVRPPTLHCDEPHPRLGDTRFETTATAGSWDDGPGGAVRRAGVNAFGFGGINAHTVLEEWPVGVPAAAPAPRDVVADGTERVVLLAADTTEELLGQLDDPGILLDRDDSSAPPSGSLRLAMVDPDDRRVELARKVIARGTAWRGRNSVWFSGDGLVASGGRTAFLFPGVEPVFSPDVDDVAGHFGLEWTPPATTGDGAGVVEDGLGHHGAGIIALGRMLGEALGAIGIRPDVVGGHSIGEWSAMIAAEMVAPDGIDEFIGSVDLDAIDVPPLVFAALGCGAEEAGEAIEGVADVALSHDNCPRQSVVCGTEDAVAIVLDRLRERQVMAQRLPFRSGFHSPMLAPFLEPARRDATRTPLQPPVVPVWSATDVAPYPSDPDAVRDLVVRHLVEPVRFRSLVERLYEEGIRIFVVVGQGSLSGFVDDTLGDRAHATLDTVSERHAGLAQIRRLAAGYWAEGGTVRFDRLREPAGRSASSGPAAGAATNGDRASVGVALGAPLVRMDPETVPALGLGAAPEPTIGGDHPVLAEFGASLREAASLGREVLTAWEGGSPAEAPPRPVVADEAGPATLRELRPISV
ncbi:MAG: beta-ketoacyl synthase N-terminal-like domain-containing protein, partial [Actinomycetota bacterium]